MKKFYYLSSCDTCKRILSQLDLPGDFTLQDIKSEPIGVSDLETLRELAGSYEALFSKRARLYKERNLKNQALSETDYRDLILEHYTFLKRPVTVIDDRIYVGNAAKTTAAVKEVLQS